MTALALVNNLRTPLLPNAPTLADTRLYGRAIADLVRPVRAGRHAQAGDRQAQCEVRRVFVDKEFVDKYVITRGQVPAINTPDEFAKEIVAGREAAKEVVKQLGLEPQ